MFLTKIQSDDLIKDLKTIRKVANDTSRWGDIKFADDCAKIVKLIDKQLKILNK
jgi:hypothetical protein